MASKLGRVVTYHEGLPPIKSYDPLNTWFFEITWQTKTIMPLLKPLCLWPTNLKGWLHAMRSICPLSKMNLWSRGIRVQIKRFAIAKGDLFFHYGDEKEISFYYFRDTELCAKHEISFHYFTPGLSDAIILVKLLFSKMLTLAKLWALRSPSFPFLKSRISKINYLSDKWSTISIAHVYQNLWTFIFFQKNHEIMTKKHLQNMLMKFWYGTVY